VQKKQSTLGALGVAILTMLAVFLTACGGGGGYSNTANVNDGSGDTTCITQLDANQKAQLTDYVNKNHDQVNSVSNNSDGTQDVCILEKSGNGYEEHYYRQQDHFNDYLLYSMMFGYSHTFATYGLLTGDLNPAEYLTLQLLTNVNSNGGVYSPYARQSNGSWSRQTNTTTIINKNITVNNIQYGSSAPKSFASAKNSPPPSGYAKQTMPKQTASTGTIQRGGFGVKSVSPVNSPTAKPNFSKNSPPPGSTGGSKSTSSGGKSGSVSSPRK